MHDCAADDLEGADLLALARLDDDGAPPAVTPAAGQGRQVICLAGARQVTARQAEMIRSSALGPARVPTGPVIAAVAGWGQACRAERVGGRR